MSRVHFHATRPDIQMVCGIIDSKLDLKVLRTFEIDGEHRDHPVEEYPRLQDIPNLGLAESGNSSMNTTFVLIDRSVELRPGVQDLGLGRCYTYMSATLSDAAVSFQPGGEFGSDGIIMGEVMWEMKSKQSERIVRAFRTAMKKHFGCRARGHWIGPDAMARLREGARLTGYYEHPDPSLVDIRLSEVECEGT